MFSNIHMISYLTGVIQKYAVEFTCLLLISNLLTLWPENVVVRYQDTNHLKAVETLLSLFFLCLNMWTIFVNTPCALEENVHFSTVECYEY